MMIKAVFGAALLCALPTVAQAEPFNGPYVGLEGGIDQYELSAKADLGAFDPSLAGTTVTADGLSGNGVTGGVFAGYNYAFQRGFFGVEGFGRLSNANIKVTATDGTNTVGAKVEARESYGIAGRVGVRPTEGTAIYGRVGWVNTRFKASVNDGSGWLSDSDTKSGVEFGGGIETLIGTNMSLRAEYIASDYGNAGLGDGVKLDNGTFRAGVSFQF